MLKGFVEWPEDFASLFRDAGVWRDESMLVDLQAPALVDPSPLALIDANATLNRGAMWTAVAQRAAGLRSIGLNVGDRLVIQLPNSNNFVITFLACLWAGVIPVMALPGHRRGELIHVAHTTAAKGICVSSQPAPDVDFLVLAGQVAKEVPSVEYVIEDGSHYLQMSLDDYGRAPMYEAQGCEIALFLLSGGTTGLPKLIARTHNDYAYHIRTSSDVTELGPHSRYLVALPAGHNFPLGCPGLLGTISHGGVVIMASSPSEKGAFGLARQHLPTLSSVVPAIAISWMQSEARDALSSLTVLQVGGARLNPEVAQQVKPRLGCTLQQVFGMAEGLLNYTHLDDPDHVIIGTQGRKVSSFDEIKIVDEDDHPVPLGQVGELLTRGPYTIRGYFGAPEHNSRSFTHDGYYRSGDLVRSDAEGNLIVEGRSNEHINRGGEKISAEEIENIVLAHPNVLNAAAVGITDPILGERICVFAEVSGPIELEELRILFVERGVATFKAPEHLEIVEALPVTNVGKIDKVKLRGQLNSTKGT